MPMTDAQARESAHLAVEAYFDKARPVPHDPTVYMAVIGALSRVHPKPAAVLRIVQAELASVEGSAAVDGILDVIEQARDGLKEQGNG